MEVLDIRSLGPQWLPPVVRRRRTPEPLPGKMCCRCGIRPAVTGGPNRNTWCAECDKHWHQIYNAGGFWNQCRPWLISVVRDYTLLRMELIQAKARYERTKEKLEAVILAGEPETWKKWAFDDFGRAHSGLEKVRNEIREHRGKITKQREQVKPLP